MTSRPQSGTAGERIAVAMSGGVDSSAAAALLRDQGANIVGVTAIMTHERSRCCSSEDVQTAARVASELGMAHHVVDVREAFQAEVIEPFTAAYLAGRTPSPCAACNREIKFGALMERARALGAARLATGHYARTARGGDDSPRLLRGADGVKDQSYFLARLTPAQLRRALFPLGGMTKAEVVRYVRARGLAPRGSRESQELCFVTEGTHGEWLDVRCLLTPGPGDIEDGAGNRIGRHRGIHHYTIGQRKGLGIAVGKPVYVVAIDAPRNVIVVGGRAEASGRAMRVEAVQWAGEATPRAPFRAEVQIRYNHLAAAAAVDPRGEDLANVCFDEPQFAVTPGQLAVFYRGEEVLGSGWIGAGAGHG